MPDLNHLNSLLYVTEGSVRIPVVGKDYKINVEIYRSTKKVKQISAYTFHPYKMTFWANIKNWFIEIFYGKTAVLVKVQSESSLLYMKVDELSKLLKISSRDILKKVKNNDASDFLISYQIEKAAKKVKKLAIKKGILWDESDTKNMKTIIEQTGYKNIIKVIENRQFDSKLMISTLMKVTKILAKAPQSDLGPENFYKFEVFLPDIFIWKIVKGKKTKINLKDYTVTVEELISNKVKKKKSLFQKSSVEKGDFKDRAEKMGIAKENIKHLSALAKRVGYQNLIHVLNDLNDDAKKIMMNTFVEIGRELSFPVILDGIMANFRLKYVGRKKEDKKENNNQITYAYAINKEDILINQQLLDKGTSKIVSNAILLNDLQQNFVRIKINKQEGNGAELKSNQKKQEKAIQELRKEADCLEKLHKNKKESGCSYIVLPFACEIISDKMNKNIILFQKKYDGKGEELKGVSVFHQLHAFRDIAKGLAYIHTLGLVHMDMKPPNFLFEGNVESKIPIIGKVSDFGMTTEIGGKFPGGTLFYLPHECLWNGTFESNPASRPNEKIDSFCLGVTILEILYAQPSTYLGILKQSQLDQIIEKCCDGISKSHPEKESIIKLAILGVVNDLLRYEPSERITCAEAGDRLDDIIITNFDLLSTFIK